MEKITLNPLPEKEKEALLAPKKPEQNFEHLIDNINNHLEELSNPEKLEAALKSEINKAETEMAFTGGRVAALSCVAGIEIPIEGEVILPEVMNDAVGLFEDTKNALEKLKNLDLKKLATSAAKGVKEFLQENALTLSPLLLTPLAAMTGGDVNTAMKASIELSVGMYSIDKILDMVMSNAEEVLPPQYLVALLAATTNLAEAGASQAAVFAGDALEDVASTPLGSNPTNAYLTGFALMGALKTRAVTEGSIKEGEKMNLKAMIKTLKNVDWKSMKKELGMSGMLAADALLFQFLVRPQMKKGNFIPMAGWTIANIPLLINYFRKTTFSKSAKIKNSIENVGQVQIKKMQDELLNNMDNFDQQDKADSIQSILETIDQYKNPENEKNSEQPISEIKKQTELLKEEFANDPQFKEEVEKIINQADMKDLKSLLKMTGVKFEGDRKKVDKKKVAKMIAGMLAVGGLATILDAGVTDMAEALPYLSKGPAGFVFMSFFSSIGEFQVSKKFFEKGQDNAATRNITDSNAINIGLAKGAMATKFIKNLF